jgi:ABC-type multidrug transport system ATPase subunit
MIKISNLTKIFNNNEALSSLSFEIVDNSITTVIGPNGSGKTTLFRCLSDIYNYNGSIKYDNLELKDSKDLIKSNLCFVSDNDSESIKLKVIEFIYLMLKFYPNSNDNKLITLIDLYDLNKYLHFYINECSHGTIKKIHLIIGFLSNTKYLILDEPFNGLDPEYSIITKKIITKLVKGSKTIIISNHNLNIVEEISDNILLLQDGKEIYSGSYKNFKIKYDFENLENNWNFILGIKTNYEDKINSIF